MFGTKRRSARLEALSLEMPGWASHGKELWVLGERAGGELSLEDVGHEVQQTRAALAAAFLEQPRLTVVAIAASCAGAILAEGDVRKHLKPLIKGNVIEALSIGLPDFDVDLRICAAFSDDQTYMFLCEHGWIGSVETLSVAYEPDRKPGEGALADRTMPDFLAA